MEATAILFRGLCCPVCLLDQMTSSETAGRRTQSALYSDKRPFDFMKACQHWIVGVAAATVRHLGNALRYVGDRGCERREFGCVRVHGAVCL